MSSSSTRSSLYPAISDLVTCDFSAALSARPPGLKKTRVAAPMSTVRSTTALRRNSSYSAWCPIHTLEPLSAEGDVVATCPAPTDSKRNKAIVARSKSFGLGICILLFGEESRFGSERERAPPPEVIWKYYAAMEHRQGRQP